MLYINNAFKQFKDGDNTVSILKNVSLSIDKGIITGLAGPSGSGKSTLLRCIEGLDTLNSGEIKTMGTTGFMFQDFQLFPHMTVLENLIYAPMTVKKIKESEAKQEAMDLLIKLGIESKSSKHPISLSGGQKQRVALARSLMMKPDILLCDEPTSGLDIATVLDVVALLNKVHSMGVTMVIASHDLDFLTEIAHRIIVLKNGEIRKDMNPREYANPIIELKKYYTA